MRPVWIWKVTTRGTWTQRIHERSYHGTLLKEPQVGERVLLSLHGADLLRTSPVVVVEEFSHGILEVTTRSGSTYRISPES
jgi:hypothetical protein